MAGNLHYKKCFRLCLLLGYLMMGLPLLNGHPAPGD